MRNMNLKKSKMLKSHLDSCNNNNNIGNKSILIMLPWQDENINALSSDNKEQFVIEGDFKCQLKDLGILIDLRQK